MLDLAVGAGVCALALVMAWGAYGLPSDPGYTGVGANFMPWVVAGALGLFGLLLCVQAMRGKLRPVSDNPISEHSLAESPTDSTFRRSADWKSFIWVAAGLLLNAALIERVGFVLSCALCFVLAVRGLRLAEGKSLPLGSGGWQQLLRDIGIGLLLSTPVFWLFTKGLNVNLPGLTGTGWL